MLDLNRVFNIADYQCQVLCQESAEEKSAIGAIRAIGAIEEIDPPAVFMDADLNNPASWHTIGV